MSTFTERVYAMVRRVPRGQVVSYGGVAALLGHPRAARGVGQALHALPDDADVPWWRVVNRNGEISIRADFHGPQLQRALLEGEGVEFGVNGRIDWKRFGWDGGGRGTPSAKWLARPCAKRVSPAGAHDEGHAADPMSHFAEGVPRPTGVKRSVALVIRHHARADMLLLVQRPDDDEDLPGVWGLPAASLVEGETELDAALRAGREKLGVLLDVLDVLNEGVQLRRTYRLEMQLLSARIVSGAPRVDAAVPRGGAVGTAVPGTTRYQAWRWGELGDLRVAADLGSLCSRLALEAAE